MHLIYQQQCDDKLQKDIWYKEEMNEIFQWLKRSHVCYHEAWFLRVVRQILVRIQFVWNDDWISSYQLHHSRSTLCKMFYQESVAFRDDDDVSWRREARCFEASTWIVNRELKNSDERNQFAFYQWAS